MGIPSRDYVQSALCRWDQIGAFSCFTKRGRRIELSARSPLAIPAYAKYRLIGWPLPVVRQCPNAWLRAALERSFRL